MRHQAFGAALLLGLATAGGAGAQTPLPDVPAGMLPGLAVPGVAPAAAPLPEVPGPRVAPRLAQEQADAALRTASAGMLAAPLHFAGTLEGGEAVHPALFGGIPPVPDAQTAQRLRVALFPPDAQGQVAGSALLLDAGGHVLAGGPVRGEQRGNACRLRLELAGEVTVLDGVCTVAVLSGTLTRRAVPHGFRLVPFLLAQGGGRSDGEAWLAAE